MRIAFPTNIDLGLDSPVFNHFGSAAFFTICESEDETVSSLANSDQHHLHGQCNPLAALGGTPVDAVVVGGIGGGALDKLKANGIRVYRAIEGTVRDNLNLIRSGKLPEITPIEVCAGHGPAGGCDHH
jgi:predicted Fe-Mo cluster-binding NifX family protein